MNIIQALNDPKVFGAFFRAGTWDVWRVFLAALFGLPMTDDQLATYRRFTGRSTPPTAALHEAWLVIGRRGGKSFVLAVIAVFLACFRDWRPFLGPGEVGTVMIIAADRRQARVIMRYCLGLLQAVPMLAKLIEAQSRETIELRNRIVIEIHTASFRTTRGYTIVTALCDELAYWQSDETSAEPDVEVINALRPGMSTIPDAVLLCASSPYARRGALWDAHRRHYGRDGDEVLVWQADTRSMNPSVPQCCEPRAPKGTFYELGGTIPRNEIPHSSGRPTDSNRCSNGVMQRDEQGPLQIRDPRNKICLLASGRAVTRPRT